MPERSYVYVDGESHYIRSEYAWRHLHGPEAALHRLRHVERPDAQLVLVIPPAKVFWTRWLCPGADRTFYFTASAGDEAARFELLRALREFGLEPSVVAERNQLAKQRLNKVRAEGVIEKAKGVDIALAVRMLEDAQRNLFDVCHLYTSDVDFLPAIEAVRGHGKRVFVHGYPGGLGEQSPFLHACDLFTDLGESFLGRCAIGASP